jgi:6-phosphogluconolactonase
MLALSMEKKRELIAFLRILANIVGVVGLLAVLASCGTSPGYSYTVGGTVDGMVGSGMVLQNNGGDDRSISADGSFSFTTPLKDGSTYSIRVKPNSQPTNPSQTCSVSDGSGTINGAPVVNVVVSCVTGPTAVTVDPSGRFAYAADTLGTISAYDIDSSSGALNPICGGSTGITCPSAGTYPTSVTVDPSGKFAYAVDTVGGYIYAYTIDQTTGALGVGTAVLAGTYPTSVTVDQSGQFVYVANMGDNTISAYTIQNDGTLVELANSPFQAGTSPASIITVKLSVGEFAYETNMNDSTIWFYSISSNGDLVPLADLATGTYPSSVTVDQSGQFVYVANETSNNISVYTINQNNGILTAGTAVAAGTSPTSIITVKLSGGAEFAYVTNTVDGTIWFYSINSSNGNLTYLGQAAAGVYPSSVTVDNPWGRFAYVANMGGGSILVYKINSDGTLTIQ